MKKKKSYVENKKGKWDHDETKHNYRSNKTTKYKEKEKYWFEIYHAKYKISAI